MDIFLEKLIFANKNDIKLIVEFKRLNNFD